VKPPSRPINATTTILLPAAPSVPRGVAPRRAGLPGWGSIVDSRPPRKHHHPAVVARAAALFAIPRRAWKSALEGPKVGTAGTVVVRVMGPRRPKLESPWIVPADLVHLPWLWTTAGEDRVVVVVVVDVGSKTAVPLFYD